MGVLAHLLDTLATDLRGEHGSEAGPPQPHHLVAAVDAALAQQVLDIAQRQQVANINTTRRMTSGGLSNRRNGSSGVGEACRRLEAADYRLLHLG